MPTHAERAALILAEENSIRFLSFTATDALTLGLSIRKRFRSSGRYQKQGRGLLISVQSMAGHTLFACTVGDSRSASEDVSLQKWERVETMVEIVKRTGHCSFYAQLKAGTERSSLGGGRSFDLRFWQSEILIAAQRTQSGYR
jgi:uncharacterized protein (UPF0303 family)